MSSLTEEQRQRIESNRLKALEKRAAAQSIQSSASVQNIDSLVPSSLSQKLTNINYYSTSSPSIQTKSTNIQLSSKYSHKRSYRQKKRTNSYYSTKSKRLKYSKPDKTLTGKCKLIFRDRFVVEIDYHIILISLFENITDSKYDILTNQWSFPLSEHDNLIESVEALRPDVSLGPLPAFVLKTFRDSTSQSSTVLLPKTNWFDKIDHELVNSLYEFQKEGISFGISRNGRVLIADDMGLGKTIQALGIAHYYYEDWPLLIVAPSSMRYTWKEAIQRWLPSIPVDSVKVIDSSRDVTTSSRILILSYDLLRKYKTDLFNYGVVIMDESHYLKNLKAARTKAALPIIQQAKRAILLSGTPALSRPLELFSQILAINRYIFPSYIDYGIRYCNGIKTPWVWDFNGSSNTDELRLILEETIMIRRIKSDVLQQLPAKIRDVLILDPTLVHMKSKKLQRIAKAYFNEEKSLEGVEKLEKLRSYFHETGKAKLNAVVNYITELVEDGKKFLCFAHHTHVMDGICNALENIKSKYIRIDGNTPSKERKKLCDDFQFKTDVMVAVLSMTSNAGITLTSANLVVFAELYWNPGILIQGEDRAHRIGQKDCVLVQYLVAKGTADDVIWKMVCKKLNVLNNIGLSKDNFSNVHVFDDIIQPINVNIERNIEEEYYFPFETNENFFLYDDDES